MRLHPELAKSQNEKKAITNPVRALQALRKIDEPCSTHYTIFHSISSSILPKSQKTIPHGRDPRIAVPLLRTSYHLQRIAPEDTMLFKDRRDGHMKCWMISPDTAVGMTAVHIHHDEDIFFTLSHLLP